MLEDGTVINKDTIVTSGMILYPKYNQIKIRFDNDINIIQNLKTSDGTYTYGNRSVATIDRDVVTQTALVPDGYWMSPYKIELSSEKAYHWKMETDGIYAHNNTDDTVQAYVIHSSDDYPFYARVMSTIDSIFTITAVGTRMYTLRFDVNAEGATHKFWNFQISEIQDIYTTNNQIKNFPVPQKEGYTFLGWYDAPTGGNKIDNTAIFTKETMLYAQYEPENRLITFDGMVVGELTENDKTRNVLYDSKLGTLPEPEVREGYEFDGWYENFFKPSNIGVNAATYKIENETFKLTATGVDAFIGGAANNCITYDETRKKVYGDLIEIDANSEISFLITNPKFNKNYFIFWDENLQSIQNTTGKNEELYSNPYLWYFTTNAGTITPPSNAKYVTFRAGIYPATIGQTYETKIILKRGSIPDHWVSYYRKASPDDIITADTQYFARYHKIEYTISYNLNGGSLKSPNKTSYNVSDKFTLQNPTKEPEIFKGWQDDSTGDILPVISFDNTTGNKSYTALFSNDFIDGVIGINDTTQFTINFDRAAKTYDVTQKANKPYWWLGATAILSQQNFPSNILNFGETIVFYYELYIPRDVTLRLDFNLWPRLGGGTTTNDNYGNHYFLVDGNTEKHDIYDPISLKGGEWHTVYAYLSNNSTVRNPKMSDATNVSFFFCIVDDGQDITFKIRNPKTLIY